MNRRIRRHPSCLPASLELRCLLATITVTSAGDDVVEDGLVTLREAVQAANTNQSVDGSVAGSADDVDVIEFGDGIHSIQLSGEQFEVAGSLHLRGPESKVTLDARSLSRHFVVLPGTSAFTLENMRFVNGQSSEGPGGSLLVNVPAALNGVELTVVNSDFEDNGSSRSGGAIELWGELEDGTDSALSRITITDSTFTGNSATLSGGADGDRWKHGDSYQ